MPISWSSEKTTVWPAAHEVVRDLLLKQALSPQPDWSHYLQIRSNQLNYDTISSNVYFKNASFCVDKNMQTNRNTSFVRRCDSSLWRRRRQQLALNVQVAQGGYTTQLMRNIEERVGAHGQSGEVGEDEDFWGEGRQAVVLQPKHLQRHQLGYPDRCISNKASSTMITSHFPSRQWNLEHPWLQDKWASSDSDAEIKKDMFRKPNSGMTSCWHYAKDIFLWKYEVSFKVSSKSTKFCVPEMLSSNEDLQASIEVEICVAATWKNPTKLQ
jgi:hypothetical protein